MKLREMSDLHLESCPDYRPKVYEGESETTLILAGDICEIGRMHILLPFLEEMSCRFKAVVYVLGNHEYYGGHLPISERKLKEVASELKNVYILNNETVKLEGVNFIGCTLWTDMNNANPLDMWAVQNGLNDYRKIRYGNYTKITPTVTILEHRQSVKFLRAELSRLSSQTNIVVTHHSPCTLSIHENYRGDQLNAAYVTDLTEIMADFVPDIWIHGHMHDSFDYKVYETRVICNPKGYPLAARFGEGQYENDAFNDNMVIEI